MDARRLLDEARVIAQNGLAYAEDPYDRDCYERLLELVEDTYADALSLPPEAVRERLAEEFAPVTPKVGATAAVFDDGGRVLLMQRPDTGAWGMPGGNLEPGEGPAEGAARETREETGLDVEPLDLIDAYELPPDSGYDPHGAVTLVYRCAVVGGERAPSHEAAALAYRDPDDVEDWFADHERYARGAAAARAAAEE